MSAIQAYVLSIMYGPQVYLLKGCTLECLTKLWLIFYCGRYALDAEILRYVGEAYPKGVCSVYCTKGKDVEGPGFDFELVVVISAAKLSPQNFWCVKSIQS